MPARACARRTDSPLVCVGVVEEPVDGRGGEGLGHEFVEPAWVQVRADRDGAFLVGGVDEPIEAFGGVVSDGQQADVVNDYEVGAEDAGDGAGDGVVGAVRADEGAEVLEAEPGDFQALFDGVLAERFEEERLPGAGGPADH